MQTNRSNQIINGFSYLSIFFLPVIFPIIVWLVANDRPDVRHNAVKALWLHLVPTICIIIGTVTLGTYGLFSGDVHSVSWLAIILFALLALVSLVVYIYNIVKAVQFFID